MQGVPGQLGQHRVKIVVALAVDEPFAMPKTLLQTRTWQERMLLAQWVLGGYSCCGETIRYRG
eukprot:6481534-Amphidinium_carterae.5